ncbi:phosphatidylinositol 3,4,5-trisphosphate 5-phosphatase 1 isoform X2 [Pleurodeles waltl]|uniref:phosphatidylinositol 3,4,5-trisphosphate 5-phosphatase 1 isoform X2 n=1 Tax=Pleurodeles waltl TaxID=8319 RepID=UPI0037093A2A
MTNTWCHGNITRSKAEDLLSKSGKDGSFLVRVSESISGAYALCVLFNNCVYTYRILPNDDKLTVQATEGVPMRYFTNLEELIEFYRKENMGLVTHLQYPVQREEEALEELGEETTGELEKYHEHQLQSQPIKSPPLLPPRNFVSYEIKEPVHEGKTMPDPSIKSFTETFYQRLQNTDTSSIPEEQLNAIQEYLRLHIHCDLENLKMGSGNLPQLRKLLSCLCKGLHSELNRTLPTLESVQRLFDQELSPTSHQRSHSGDSVPAAVLSKLNLLIPLLSSIEDKIKKILVEGTEIKPRRSLIPPITFEVKPDSLGISTKIILKVDVEMGKLVIKKSKDGPDDKSYDNKKIRQLIKSQKFPNKLVIVLETEKEKTQRKEYVFSDTKKREGFCQLLQQMKNKHSGQPEPDMLTIFIGTWNMGDAPPPKKITSWFLSKGQGKTRDDSADYIEHDIYVIGTQEDPLGEKEWVDILLRTLREIGTTDFKLVTIQTLWNIRIVVLAKQEHDNRISHVCTSSVKTGIANTLGNKGAVGASFMFNGTSFGFVNSHLTSGSEKKLRRNQNYLNILRFLVLGDKKLGPFNLTHRFTHLFWLGDLNYRVELPTSEAENIVQKIRQQQYPELLPYDQLTLERRERKVFLFFDEEEITFAPTYRYERSTRDKYAYTKQKATSIKYNLPSWCDRVLWKSYPEVHVLCQSYGCTNDIMTSDHSPVFATFEVGVTSQYVSKNSADLTDSQGQIELVNCSALLQTKSKTRFYLEFHSSCLENFVKTSEGDNQELHDGELTVRFETLPKLTPIISDLGYLLDQHILVCIKSSDSDESYGEGCIALRVHATESLVPFSSPLTHHGELTGHFHGDIKLQTSHGQQREKLYDFVKIEREEPIGGRKHVKVPGTQLTEQTFRKPKNSQIVAEEAASLARVRGTGQNTMDMFGKDEDTRSTVTDISNPSYIGIGSFSQTSPAPLQFQKASHAMPQPCRGPDQQSKPNPPMVLRGESVSPSRSPVSPKKFPNPRGGPGLRSQDQTTPDGWNTADQSLPEAHKQPEMFENPLYASMSCKTKPACSRKEQDLPNASRREYSTVPVVMAPSTQPPSKLQDSNSNKALSKQLSPPVPAPRARSNTCITTEMKSTLVDKVKTNQVALSKKPVKLCRSEMSPNGIQVSSTRPPLPAKSQMVRENQLSKGQDYRESSELPQQSKSRASEEAPSASRTAMM